MIPEYLQSDTFVEKDVGEKKRVASQKQDRKAQPRAVLDGEAQPKEKVTKAPKIAKVKAEPKAKVVILSPHLKTKAEKARAQALRGPLRCPPRIAQRCRSLATGSIVRRGASTAFLKTKQKSPA